MNRYGRDGAAVTGVSGQPGVTGHGMDRVQTIRGNDRRRRESSVIDDEAAVLDREKSASTREDAAGLREGKATSREDAAGVREDAAGVREGKATSREDAAGLREDAAGLREGKATSREHVIRAAETKQAESDLHMKLVQQANALLVISTLEAQQLTEQVQKTRAELESAKLAAEKANRREIGFSFQHEP